MAATHSMKAPDTGNVRSGGFHAKLPSTNLGAWSMWLAVAFGVLWVLNMAAVAIFGRTTDPALNEFSRTVMPNFGMVWLLVGLGGGVVGLIAILKQKERSVVTLLALLPGLFCVFLLLGEFLIPH